MKKATVLSFVAVLAHPAWGQEAPAFAEKTASRWALVALGVPHNKADTAEKLAKTLAATTSKNQGVMAATVQAAFEKLQPCRVKGAHDDLAMTAAEHYMYMRMRAGETGDTNYRALPKEYLALKRKKIADGTVKELQTTQQPVSPPSEDVRRWGEMGVESGLSDYERFTGKKPSFGASAVLEGASFVMGAKYNYPYAEKRPCSIALD